MILFKKPSSWILLTSVLIFISTEIIRFPTGGVIREWRRYNNASFIEPLEIIALALCVVGVWLCFFNLQLQKRWWRIARWFGLFVLLMLGVSLMIPYQGSGFISFPGVRELVMLWAIILELFTLGFTLTQR